MAELRVVVDELLPLLRELLEHEGCFQRRAGLPPASDQPFTHPYSYTGEAQLPRTGQRLMTDAAERFGSAFPPVTYWRGPSSCTEAGCLEDNSDG